MEPYNLLLIPFVGFLVGIMIGLSGIGGGAVMTPFLIIMGIPSQIAIVTDLLFAFITKTINFILGKTKLGETKLIINKFILFYMVIGSLSGMLIASQFVKKFLIHSEKINTVLTVFLAGVLIATALGIIMINLVTKKSVNTPLTNHSVSIIDPTEIYLSISFTKMVMTLFTFGVIGFFVVLTSVGSGALGVVALLLLYPKLSIKQIVNIDICYAIPLTLLSWCSLSYATNHSGDLHLLTQLLIGSIPGTFLSKLILKRINGQLIHFLIVVLLLITSLKLLNKVFAIY